MPLLVVQFARFGPYHLTRLRSAIQVLAPAGWRVIGLETAGTDRTYAWDDTTAPGTGGEGDAPIVTVFPGRVYEELTGRECRLAMAPALDSLRPDVVAIAGWAGNDARACLSWCQRNGVKRIVMSETRFADARRVWWKELIKGHLISRFDAALVGGKSHRDYLVKLGMPLEQIRFGYNVVDNAYFAEETQDHKTQEASEEVRGRGTGGRAQNTSLSDVGSVTSPSTIHDPKSTIYLRPYFLASNRFIERKNLARLIEAYASYNQKSKIKNHQSSIWPLCLLGDGELKPALIAQCQALGLRVIESAPWESSVTSDSSFQDSGFSDSAFSSPFVYFPGFRQIDELPQFYAHAGCFIHPALEEPWGLVINEAMACGLPVLAGTNVGAAEELVDDGVNGWCFDAENAEKLTRLMVSISAFNFPLSSFGNASLKILDERCPTKAFGTGLKEILIRLDFISRI